MLRPDLRGGLTLLRPSAAPGTSNLGEDVREAKRVVIAGYTREWRFVEVRER
jgi:hypothetical protein